MKKIHKILYGVILILCPGISVLGQPMFQVKGRVFEDSNRGAAFATVRVLHLPDSGLIGGTVTDSAGWFHLEIRTEGSYVLRVSLLGWQSAEMPFQLNQEQQHVQLPPIRLHATSHALQAVQVIASRPFIEQQPGKTVIHVDGSPTAAGSDVLDILQKAPGVTVDQDGNITLKGKSGVMVMIDGRPTYLSQEQLTHFLKTIRAESISHIDVISNPSAKYDAAGSAGIIDIHLKKNDQEGYNGVVQAQFQQGRYPASSGSLELHYARHRIQAYLNGGFYTGQSFNDLQLIRNFYASDKSLQATMEQISHMRFPETNYQLRIGADLDINTHQRIGFFIDADQSREHDKSDGPISFYDAAHQLDSIASPVSKNNGKWSNMTYHLHYHWQIDTAGQELGAEFNVSPFTSHALSDDITQYFLSDGTTLRDPSRKDGELSSAISIISGKMDYTLPLNKNLKLDAGIKASHVRSDNQVQYQNWVQDKQIWITDTGLTNHFLYQEDIYAAYMSMAQDFKKGWHVQVGLRAEQTITRAHQLVHDSLVKRSYVNLFPNLMVKKDFPHDHSLSLAFNRRIDRPNYQDLNPFRYYIDQYTYQVGNPFLQPQLTYATELSYTYKNQYTITLDYSYTSNVITEYIRQDDKTRVGYQTNENLSSFNNVGISWSIPVTIARWWNTQNFLSIFYNDFQGSVDQARLTNHHAAWRFNSVQEFQLPAHIKAELSGFYQSSMPYGPFMLKPRYRIDIGFQKNLFHDKGTLKLFANDIFRTQQGIVDLRYLNTDIHVHNRWNTQKVGVSFVYHFGNQQLKVKTVNRTGIEEEQSRIKKGG